LMTRRLDSRPGTSGEAIAGRRQSPDAPALTSAMTERQLRTGLAAIFDK
jgi:hypothetical protein